MVSAAVVYALITAVSFGVANVFSKEISQTFGVVRATILRNSIVVLLIACIVLLLRTPVVLDWFWIVVGASVAVGAYLGSLFFMLALKTGKVGVVVPVASSSIIVSSLFGFFVLGGCFYCFKTRYGEYCVYRCGAGFS